MTRWFYRPFFWLLLGLGAASNACSDTSAGEKDEEDAGKWVCNRYSDGCSCDLVPSDTTSVSSDPVSGCFRYPCCLESGARNDFQRGSCECMDVPDCQAEAASRSGVTVVAECPPGGVEACAQAGENCRSDYLYDHELDGCCGGTLCRQNAQGIPVCQAASDAELALVAECSKAAGASVSAGSIELVSDVVQTSRGNLVFESATASSLGVGPAGCLTRINLELRGSGLCSLRFEVELDGTSLRTSNVSGFLSSCQGLQGTDSTSLPSGTVPETAEFRFEGVACETSFGGSYCVTGTFDWHLAGTVGTISFPDQHVTVRGTVCRASPSGSCPAG